MKHLAEFVEFCFKITSEAFSICFDASVHPSHEGIVELYRRASVVERSLLPSSEQHNTLIIQYSFHVTKEM